MIRRATKISLIFTIISALLIFAFCGCSSPGKPASEEDSATGISEDGQSGEAAQSGEEETREQPVEEVVEPVNLDSAQFGATLDGYIPSYMCTDTDNFIKVTITNTSDFTWRASGEQMVRIGYHFYGQDVEFQEYDKTSRTALPNDLAPGESAVVEVLINDIINPGSYAIHIDPVVEGYAWFSSKNVPMLEGAAFFNECKAE